MNFLVVKLNTDLKFWSVNLQIRVIKSVKSFTALIWRFTDCTLRSVTEYDSFSQYFVQNLSKLYSKLILRLI